MTAQIQPCALDPGLCYPSTWQPASPDPFQHWDTQVAAVHGVAWGQEVVAVLLTGLLMVVKLWWSSRPRGRHE